MENMCKEVVSTFKDESGVILSSTLPKTLWNCSVESALEFHRVVSDLFPRSSKQLRFVVSDVAARFLTRPWSDVLLQHEDLLQAFSTCDLPSSSSAGADTTDDCSIMNGIQMAVGVLSERTRLQERAAAIMHDNAARLAADRISSPPLAKPTTQQTSPSLPTISANSQQRLGPLHKIFLRQVPKEYPKDYLEYFSEYLSSSSSSSDEKTFGLTAEDKDENCEDDEKEEQDEEDMLLSDEPTNESAAGAADDAASSRLFNAGTVIVLTSLDRIEQFHEINRTVVELIDTRNKAIRLVADENLMTIDKVNLVVVNMLNAKTDNQHRFNAEFVRITQQLLQVVFANCIQTAPQLRSTLTSAMCGEPLQFTVRKILQEVYDLVSTTVSGIPMKEEAQQGQSINYDVELLHHRSAHLGLAAMGVLHAGSRIVSRTSGDAYDTVRLGWCTSGPKLKSDKFPLLSSSHLVTPASVNSRPTVCLTSFVLGGKCVMLEVQRDAIAPPASVAAANEKNGGLSKIDSKWLLPANLHQKLISHYLCRDSASGALAIQCVAMGSKATMDGFLVPEIDLAADEKNKAIGWRREELNLSFMRHLMASAELIIRPPATEAPAAWRQRMELTRRLRQNVWNLSQYSPLLLHDSFIFSFPEAFDSFLATLRKPLINAADFEAACVWIRNLPAFRVDGIEPVIGRECVFNGKRMPKDEQYRLIVDELVSLVNNSSHISVTHFALAKALMQTCGSAVPLTKPLLAPDLVAECEARDAAEQKKETATRRKRPDTIQEREQLAMAKRFRKKFAATWLPNESINLLEYFTSLQQQNRWTKWKDFVGRENMNDEAQAQLYPNLKLPEPTSATELTPELEKVANLAAAAGTTGEKIASGKAQHKSAAKPIAQQQPQQSRLNQMPLHGKPPMGRGGQHHYGGQSSHHDRPSPHMGGGGGNRSGGGGGRGGGMSGKSHHHHGGGAGYSQQPFRGGRGRSGPFGNRQRGRNNSGGGAPPPPTT